MFKPNKLTPGYNVLWESSRMMLPEHVERILQHSKDINETKKPTLDEQQLQEINEKIRVSLQYGLSVEINIWDDGYITVVSGIVNYINEASKLMRVKDKEKGVTSVHFESIAGVEFTE